MGGGGVGGGGGGGGGGAETSLVGHLRGMSAFEGMSYAHLKCTHHDLSLNLLIQWGLSEV